ncbi:NB-ARC domain-containing protein [Kibdelosporangium philippinense]|uniref:NB-ARC domain-containing protein n=1 Tax=Kibdelosporangium philippinense TaxID=211113 RepID=A0ABS8Z7U0_9PSEU|nr:BTAD domain-containing putative transcriptional regulator [Kibdelosporangium philippinense]MCE7003890.1 NB-ARC domain-containing protein [Kibdelosporangium philippinense]
MRGELRFEVLGPLRAWMDKTEVDLGTPRQRAVLGLLLLRDGAVATQDDLVAAIWGNAAPPGVSGMVRSYVSRLRRAFGDGRPATTLKTVGGGYVLSSDPDNLDLAAFQRRINVAREAKRSGDIEVQSLELRTALSLWQGTPLTGIHGEYVEAERVRLAQIKLAVTEDLAEADLKLGKHAETMAGLMPLIKEHPLRERPRELLMLALYRSGRQAEALALYQESQRLFAEELGIDPGPELQRMHQRILQSDPDLTVSEPVRRPAQLPPGMHTFTGRDRMVHQLATTLTNTSATIPIVGLTGLAGVGKTTTAIHIGHKVAGCFPDGQYFVNLQSTDDPLAVLLRSSLATVPDSRAERVALWRSMTTGRRILLILDNATDIEQVYSLLPGSNGPAVVITSRSRLDGLTCAAWHKLTELSEEDSLTLFSHIVGEERTRTEPEEARLLARRTAGLPHLIHTVAARVAARPEWSLRTALKRLRTVDIGMEAYESALHDLPTKQARALRLLAIPVGPDISLAAAAAALDLPVDETEDLLEALADSHFVDSGPGDHYRLLTPIRDFARSRAHAIDGQRACHEVLTRVVKFYAATARNALQRATTRENSTETGGLTFTSAAAARTWLLAERSKLRATATQAANIPDAPAEALGTLIDGWPGNNA